MHRPSFGQCRPAHERGYASLAPQRLLDALRPGLQPVDDRPIPVDLLRSLSSPGIARPLSRRCYILSSWHPDDGGTCPAASSNAQRIALALRVSGFRTAPHLVDVLVRLCRDAVALCLAIRRAVLLFL